MTWFRVDDTFYRSKKVRKLGQDRVPAVGLWTLCGDWSADNLTDGFVPWEVVDDWDPSRAWAERLIYVGLWSEAEVDGEKGVQFHDWTDYQPTKAEVDRRRDDARERMRKLRSGRSGEQKTEHDDRFDECSIDGSQDVRANTARTDDERSRDVPDPVPSRPVVPKGTTSGAAQTRRATRIPPDFAVTPAMVEWARQKTPDVDGKQATEKFIDFWRAKSGKDATKLDWPATWRNWMRDDQERTQRRPTHLRPLPSQPALLPSDPALAFADLRKRGDAQRAADLAGVVWIEPSQPRSDQTPFREWVHQQRVAFIDKHASVIRAALEHSERSAG